jgi:hypothetical protein
LSKGGLELRLPQLAKPKKKKKNGVQKNSRTRSGKDTGVQKWNRAMNRRLGWAMDWKYGMVIDKRFIVFVHTMG